MKPGQIGYLENGTGKHQSNIVWNVNTVSPTITTLVNGGTQQIKVLVKNEVCMLINTNKFQAQGR